MPQEPFRPIVLVEREASVTVDTVLEDTVVVDTVLEDTVVVVGETEEKVPDPVQTNLFFRLRLHTHRCTERRPLLRRRALHRTIMVVVEVADLQMEVFPSASTATSLGIFDPNAPCCALPPLRPLRPRALLVSALC